MEEYNDEWHDEKFVCDNCGNDEPGAYYVIKMYGWAPMCICEDCANDMVRYNE